MVRLCSRESSHTVCQGPIPTPWCEANTVSKIANNTATIVSVQRVSDHDHTGSLILRQSERVVPPTSPDFSIPCFVRNSRGPTLDRHTDHEDVCWPEGACLNAIIAPCWRPPPSKLLRPCVCAAPAPGPLPLIWSTHPVIKLQCARRCRPLFYSDVPGSAVPLVVRCHTQRTTPACSTCSFSCADLLCSSQLHMVKTT